MVSCGVNRSRRGFGRTSVYLGLFSSLFASCTLLLDTQSTQCETDADCWARGLSPAVCVQQVCERAEASSSMAAQTTSAMAEPARTVAEPEASAERTSPAEVSTAPADAGTRAAATQTRSASSAPGTSTPGTDAPAAEAAGAPACVGDGCPECATDADCELSGRGSRCIDKICWEAQPQCSADVECVTLGPEYEGGRCVSAQCRPNPRWRCEAPTSGPTTEQKTLSVLVRDSLSLNPVSMVHIVACQKLDLTCANPTAEATTDGDGMLSITVPAAFAGYLQQTERREYAPAMYFLPSVLPDDGMLHPFPLLSSGAIIDALAASLGAGVDPERGNLMLIAEDCFGMAQPGVTFMSPQSDDKTVQFYVRDLLPSTSAQETAEIGNGGYLNFPAGTALIQVDRPADDLHLSTVSIVVRAGFISVAYIQPMPR